jgi:dTMP kinase
MRKSIEEKDFVLSNRYTTSNIVHQATKLEDEKEQQDIISFIENIEYDILALPKPDKVIFLDMYIDIAWELNKKRG